MGQNIKLKVKNNKTMEFTQREYEIFCQAKKYCKFKGYCNNRNDLICSTTLSKTKNESLDNYFKKETSEKTFETILSMANKCYDAGWENVTSDEKFDSSLRQLKFDAEFWLSKSNNKSTGGR